MKYSLVPYDIIEKAVSGDVLAIDTILNHYESYITALSLQTCMDADGNQYSSVNNDIKMELQAKLTAKIFCFKIMDKYEEKF